MNPLRSTLWRFLALVLWALGGLSGRSGAAEFTTSAWTALDGRAALVHVPEGTKRVRLQTRGAAAEGWKIEGIVHLPGRAGTVKLRLPDGVALENIAVETSRTDPFPYAFYQGQSTFDAAPSVSPGGVRNGGVLAPGGAELDGAGEGAGAPAAVQESDIWKWRDRTLYYFNTMRGLQVFDLRDFERPRRVGGLRLPAVGEDMYLLGSEHVVLLANRPDYSWGAEASSGPRSEVIVVRHAGEVLAEVARVPVDGAFLGSRMVGSTLCVATQKVASLAAPGGGVTYLPRQHIYAIDLADPAAPRVQGPLEIPQPDGAWSWDPVVQATSEFFFLATNSWQPEGRTQTRLHVIDLRTPGQPLTVAAQFNLAGQLRNKFQISCSAGILTTVSENGGALIETWDLQRALLGAGPAAPVPLDSLMVGRNESLFATRFDGTRVYVVTFRRIDPLFCVELADPRALRLLGELEVPGFSTYLESFADGSRLLSLGVEDSRVAVSLFDTSNPASPTLKSRVRLGDGEHWSWSEGNYDDKAIGFFQNAGLMVFPLQQWTADHGYRTGMQLVDATADGLRARGFIDHRFSARRGRLFDQTLVSIGPTELLVLDLADRDHPRPISALTVAWPVQVAVPYGEALVQLEDGDQVATSHDGTAAPRPVRLRLTPQSDPDAPTVEVDLGRPGQIAGAVVRGDFLYALVRSIEGRSVPAADGTVTLEWSSFMTQLAIDLAAPGGPRLAGAVTSGRDGYAWSYGRLESHWLPDGRLVWYPAEPTGGSFGWRCLMCPVDVAAGAALDDGMVGLPWRWGGSPPDDILVVDLAEAANPKIVAREAVVPGEETAYSGRVFVSADNRLLASWSTWQVTDGVWAESSRIQEIDLTDSAAPRRGPVAPVSALVQGIHRTGAGGLVLFASRQEIVIAPDTSTTWTNNALVDALAYDGTQAFLLDTVRMERAAQMPTVVAGPHFLALRQSVDAKPGSSLGALAWEEVTGQWIALPDIALAARWPTLLHRGGYLFVSDSSRLETLALHQLPEAPTRTAQALDAPVWDFSQVVIDRPHRAAWLPVGPYGVENLDLSTLPSPPLERASRDRASPEWQSLPLLVIDIVHAGDRVGGTVPLEGEVDYSFAADGDAERYDAWAVRHFDDPARASAGALDDPDHDGFGNYAEWAFGTVPTDPDSQPAVTSALMLDEAGRPQRLVLVARLNPLATVQASGVSSYLSLVPELSTDFSTWRSISPEEIESTATPVRRLWSLPVPTDAPAAFGRLTVFFVSEG